MNVLVIAAHPDDEILGMAGSIKKFSLRHDVYVCYMITSITGRKNAPAASTKEMFIDGDGRKKQILKVQKILNIKDTMTLDYPNIELNTVPTLDLVQSIEKAILLFKPEVIFTHYYNDLNEDHRIVFNATMAASKLPERRYNSELNIIKKILCYEVPSSTNWSPKIADNYIYPDTYIDISDTFESKMEALKVYEKEIRNFPHPISYEAIKITAQLHGGKINSEYAEAFHLVREIVI